MTHWEEEVLGYLSTIRGELESLNDKLNDLSDDVRTCKDSLGYIEGNTEPPNPS